MNTKEMWTCMISLRFKKDWDSWKFKIKREVEDNKATLNTLVENRLTLPCQKWEKWK